MAKTAMLYCHDCETDVRHERVHQLAYEPDEWRCTDCGSVRSAVDPDSPVDPDGEPIDPDRMWFPP